jgi:hypothetical protein
VSWALRSSVFGLKQVVYYLVLGVGAVYLLLERFHCLLVCVCVCARARELSAP